MTSHKEVATKKTISRFWQNKIGTQQYHQLVKISTVSVERDTALQWLLITFVGSTALYWESTQTRFQKNIRIAQKTQMTLLPARSIINSLLKRWRTLMIIVVYLASTTQLIPLVVILTSMQEQQHGPPQLMERHTAGKIQTLKYSIEELYLLK